MNRIAAECKSQRHHPEWTNIYNKTQIRWTTHNPSGLSEKDVAMARFCDERGRKLGEIGAVEDGDGSGGKGEKDSTAGRAEERMQAGDCCGGKKKV